jgi:hypothetical protein
VDWNDLNLGAAGKSEFGERGHELIGTIGLPLRFRLPHVRHMDTLVVDGGDMEEPARGLFLNEWGQRPCLVMLLLGDPVQSMIIAIATVLLLRPLISTRKCRS